MAYDVVVIGGGAAGITIARDLGQSGVRVALAEAGGLAFTPESQDIYGGEVIGEIYSIEASRLRYMGGTTNHWSGWCRPLDAAQFQSRDDIPYSGWPISKADIDPYLEPALNILDIDENAIWKPQTLPDFGNQNLSDYGLEEVYWQWSTPTRFRQKYYEDLIDNDNVDVLLFHSLIDVETDSDGSITSAIFRDTDNEVTTRIEGRLFVLACGGIENARLLLYLNQSKGTQWGDQANLLGKHFMEHPHVAVGDFVVIEPNYTHQTFKNESHRFFAFTAPFQRQQNILACSLRMTIASGAHRDSLVDSLATHSTLPHAQQWQAGTLVAVTESLPVAENHVRLSEDRDAFGIPRSELHWRVQSLDIETMRVMVRQFTNFMLNTNLGRCRLADWVLNDTPPERIFGGNHHIGTTKMSSDAEDGVVDTDCRLYGTENLFVAGSSVFPTSGHANPTLTIIQLALRLSRHIQQIIST